MRPPVFSRIFVAAGTVLVFWMNCPKDTAGFWSKTPSASQSESSGTKSSQPCPALDLKEMRERLAFQEKQLPQDGNSRVEGFTEMARLSFVLGELEERDEREKYYEKGKYYAQLLCGEEPARVEGHYWLALNICGLAEVGGARRALGLIPAIIHELDAAAAIDETYDQAGPHRILGRIYCKAPCWPLSEGDMGKSYHHLSIAVRLAPGNSTNHLYLAETLVQLGKREEASRELEDVMEPTCHAIFPHNLEEDHQDAILLLKHCK